MITTVLLDADGVIQTWSPALRTTAAGLIEDPGKADVFIRELAAAEAPCLRGDRDLRDAFRPVLARWNNAHRMDEVLDMLTLIVPDGEILDVVASMRAKGIRCCLASNQQAWRAAYMSRELGYGQRFEAEFYSCHLGTVKPEPDYFRAVLDRLSEPPARVLFIDDRQTNVESARDCGLCGAQFGLDAGSGVFRDILRQYGLPAP